MNKLIVNLAEAIKEYCDDRSCIGCPFAPKNEDLRCRIGTPAYWDLSNTLDYPNSNKQTEDGSDLFDE